MKIYDRIGFLLMKFIGLYWKLFRREHLWSVRKMRKDEEGIVYF